MERGVICEIASDLEALSRSGRSFRKFRNLNLGAIKEAAAALDVGPVELAELLAAAQERIVDTPVRRAVAAIFPLPYSGDEWPALMVRVNGKAYTRQRRKDQSAPDDCAAEHLGDYYNALFAKSRSSGRRKIDDLYEEYAAAVLSEIADRSSRPLSSGPGPSRSRLVGWTKAAAAGLMAAAAVITGYFALVHETSPSSSVSAPPGALAPRCGQAVIGELDVNLRDEPQADSWSHAMRAAARRAGSSGESVGCGARPGIRRDGLIVQEVTLSGEPNGALVAVADDPRRAWWFNRALWGSYREVQQYEALISPEQGVPEKVQDHDAHVEVRLSSGALLVAEARHAPFFWIPAPHVQWWRKHPEVGLPTSHPHEDAPRQDVEHGYVTVSGGSRNPVFHRNPEPAKSLPPARARRRRILRQADGTAWWITAADERRWIPDGGTYECLGGDAVLAADGVPGAAIATLRLAEWATC